MQSTEQGDVALSVTLDTSGLKKETEKIKKEIEKGVATSNTEIKPQTDVKPIQIVIQQAKQASAALQQTVKNASNVANEIGDVDKNIPTEEFAQLSQNAAWLEKELEKANSQLDHMDLINEDNTKRFSNLANKANELETALKRTKDQMQAMIDLGEAFEKVTAPQDDATQREAELARLQAILDRNRESANELATEMENVAVASNDAANSFAYENPLEKTDLPEQFKDKVEETQQEIANTQEQTINQFEGEYARFIEYIQASEQKAREMAEVIAGLKDVGVDPDQLAQMEKEYDTLINKIALMRQSIKIGSTAWNEMEPKERLVLFIDRLKLGLNEIGQELTTKVNDGLNELSKNLGNVAKNAAKSSLQGLSKWFRKLVPDLNRTNRGFNLGIKNILGYAIGIRSLFSLFTKLRSAITEGIHNLAQWRDGNNEVNENLSVFISSLLQLKNQIGAAFAPIINIVVPILNTFIASMTEAMNVLAQFIAKITGQQSWIRATKVQKNYADSLKGTAKAAKDASGALAPFDDLQILNKKSTGAGSIDPNDMFEEISLTEMDEKVNDWINKLKLSWEMADFTDFGKDIGEWLRSALESIDWGNIKEIARKIAKSIATMINGFIETERLGELIGKTIAEAINTAFEFIYNLISNLDWSSIGKFIGEMLLAFVKTIDGKLIGETLGKALWSAIQLAFYTVKTFAEGNGFKELGRQLSNIINGFFEKMAQVDKQTGKNGWQMLGETLSTGVIGIIDAIIIALDGVSWENVGQAIANFISDIDWATITFDLLKLAEKIVSGVATAIGKLTNTDPAIIEIAGAISAALVLASAVGFNLPSIALSTPELIITAAAVAVTGKAVNWLNTKMDEGFDADRVRLKDENFGAELEQMYKAIESGAIYSEDALNRLETRLKSFKDWKGLTIGAEVADEEMRKLREAMAAVHPELESQLKMHGELNGSYEAAAESIEKYNRLHHKLGEEYTIIYSEFEQENGAVRNLGNTFDSAGVAIERVDSSIHDITNEVANSSGVMLEEVNSVDNVTNAMVELHPAVGDAITDFEVLETTVSESGDEMSSGFLAGLNSIKQGWEKFWNDLIFWFKDCWGIASPSKVMMEFGVDIIQGLLNGIESLKDNVIQLWDRIKNAVGEKVGIMRDYVMTKVDNLKLSFLGAFVEIQSRVISIWNKIKDGLKTPMNAILAGIETMVNGFIKAINKMIDGINSLGSVKIPDWAKDKFGMGDISINIPTLKEVSLPRLAQGAVIPPNREFMAVLGDQRQGTNIEAPLDTITQAFAEVVGSMRSNGNAVMTLDGQTFARLVIPYVMNELDRRGYNVKVLEG